MDAIVPGGLWLVRKPANTKVRTALTKIETAGSRKLHEYRDVFGGKNRAQINLNTNGKQLRALTRVVTRWANQYIRKLDDSSRVLYPHLLRSQPKSYRQRLHRDVSLEMMQALGSRMFSVLISTSQPMYLWYMPPGMKSKSPLKLSVPAYSMILFDARLVHAGAAYNKAPNYRIHYYAGRKKLHTIVRSKRLYNFSPTPALFLNHTDLYKAGQTTNVNVYL